MSEATTAGQYKPPRSVKVIFSSSVLMCEAFVVFFSTLVAYGLGDHSRIVVWIVGLALAIVLVGACATLKRSWGFLLGHVLQAAIIALGFLVPAMFVVGIAFAALWAFGVYQGARMDRERRAWDAQVLAETGELPFNDEDLPKSML
ncbi:DUF4233 domain-containing protein [Micrococcales bacterium 31B]|nr:DUF4233 domain-containing protein [Micrococcales bacterium 31B]